MCILFDHFLENDIDAQNYEAAFNSAGFDTRCLKNPTVKVQCNAMLLFCKLQLMCMPGTIPTPPL